MIVAYHEFSETPVRDVYAITRETFLRHALLAANSGGLKDCITFDDAHHSQFTIAAPVLNQLNIPASSLSLRRGQVVIRGNVMAGTA